MRKTLQILLGLFGVTAILIAALHIVLGPTAIPGAVPVNATMDSEDRFYAVLFLAFGATLLWCIKAVERKANVVYFLMLTFLVGGFARLISILAVGLPNNFFIAMTVLELVLPFVYAYLAYRVSAVQQIRIGRAQPRPHPGLDEPGNEAKRLGKDRSRRG